MALGANPFDRDMVNEITKKLTKGSKYFAFAYTILEKKGPQMTHALYIDGTEFIKDSDSPADDSQGKGTPIAATELFEKARKMVEIFSKKTATQDPSYIVLNLDSMYSEIFTDRSDEMFDKFKATPNFSKILVLSFAMDNQHRHNKMRSSLNVNHFASATRVNTTGMRLITTESSISNSDSFVNFLCNKHD